MDQTIDMRPALPVKAPQPSPRPRPRPQRTSIGVATIRPAAAQDASTIAQIQSAAWINAYRELISPERLYRVSTSARTTRWQQRLLDPQIKVLLAEVDTNSAIPTVAGFCALQSPSPDQDAGPGIAQIIALYVHPDFWRLGLGSALLSASLASLPQDFTEVTLWVIEDQQAAYQFYLDAGFSKEGAERLLSDKPNVYKALRLVYKI